MCALCDVGKITKHENVLVLSVCASLCDMVRPLRQDRDSVAATTLTLRLTETESVALEALAVRRTEQLGAYGVHLVTKASLVRTLIQQAARAEGLLPALVKNTSPLPLPVALPVIPSGPDETQRFARPAEDETQQAKVETQQAKVEPIEPAIEPAIEPVPIEQPILPSTSLPDEPKSPLVEPTPVEPTPVEPTPDPTTSRGEVGLDVATLRDRFLAARTASRVTNSQLALALGFDASAVSRWVGGRGLPEKHWKTVDSMLIALGF